MNFNPCADDDVFDNGTSGEFNHVHGNRKNAFFFTLFLRVNVELKKKRVLKLRLRHFLFFLNIWFRYFSLNVNCISLLTEHMNTDASNQLRILDQKQIVVCTTVFSVLMSHLRVPLQFYGKFH